MKRSPQSPCRVFVFAQPDQGLDEGNVRVAHTLEKVAVFGGHRQAGLLLGDRLLLKHAGRGEVTSISDQVGHAASMFPA